MKESIKNWNEQLGEISNQYTTSSWCLHLDNLYHSGEGDNFHRVTSLRIKVGDLSKIEFDFIEKTVKMFHNDIEMYCRELLVRKLWVGVSLNYFCETIQMIEYKYD